jgi:HlyD family secretion protein
VPVPPRRWKTRLLLPGCILAAFLGLAGYAFRSALWPRRLVSVMPVVTKEGGEPSGTLMFQAAGWVEPDPFPTHISALTDGVVREVLVREGQQVKAGDVVARLVDDDARLALKLAEAELHHRTGHLEILKATLRAAQLEWDNPVDREKAVAQAAASEAEAKAELIKSDSEIDVEENRLKELEEQLRREDIAAAANAIPDFQRIQTRLKLNTQRATLASIRANVDVLKAKLTEAQADLRAAQENLRLRISEKRALEEADGGVCEADGQIKMSEVMVEQARLKLERTEIRSPVDGVVMQRLAEPGGKLMMQMDEKSSAQVARLYNPEKLQVRTDVPLADAARVGVGQQARVTVEVLRDKVFNGTVSRIVNEADIQKNTIQVKVALLDPSPELKPEMLARVQFLSAESATKSTESRHRIYALESAIEKNGGQGTAWVVDKGRGTALQRPVTLGSARIDGWIEITEGLQPGDALIVGDRSGLRDGDAVRFVEEQNVVAKESAHGLH